MHHYRKQSEQLLIFWKAIFNPLSANPTRWSNTLKQFLGKLPTNCLRVFAHFVRLALKGLTLVNLHDSLLAVSMHTITPFHTSGLFIALENITQPEVI